jgi:hypothetical protein
MRWNFLTSWNMGEIVIQWGVVGGVYKSIYLNLVQELNKFRFKNLDSKGSNP